MDLLGGRGFEGEKWVDCGRNTKVDHSLSPHHLRHMPQLMAQMLCKQVTYWIKNKRPFAPTAMNENRSCSVTSETRSSKRAS